MPLNHCKGCNKAISYGMDYCCAKCQKADTTPIPVPAPSIISVNCNNKSQSGRKK